MIVIRKAMPKDEDKIKDILKTTGFSMEDFKTSLENTMVVENDGLIVGCGALKLVNDLAIIIYIFILPEHRGQGFGDGLTRAMINYADRRNIKKMYLLSNKSSNYYMRLGFTEASQKYLQGKQEILKSQKVNMASFDNILELDIKKFFSNPHCSCQKDT